MGSQSGVPKNQDATPAAAYARMQAAQEQRQAASASESSTKSVTSGTGASPSAAPLAGGQEAHHRGAGAATEAGETEPDCTATAPLSAIGTGSAPGGVAGCAASLQVQVAASEAPVEARAAQSSPQSQ